MHASANFKGKEIELLLSKLETVNRAKTYFGSVVCTYLS